MKTFFLFILLSVSLYSAEIARGKSGAVACAETNACKAGLTVLKEGGNAFDAAVVVATSLAVTHPQAGNVGGGGFAIIRLKSGKIEALDFRETAPEKAYAEMYLDQSGQMVPGKSLNGPIAAGVPGTVAGLWVLHSRYGALSWERCLKPAIKLANEGFIVDTYLANLFVEYEKKMRQWKSTEAAYYPNNKAPGMGDRLIQKDLEKVLKTISVKGRDGFYQGWVAEKIESFMNKNGGLISGSDLIAYQPVWRQAGEINFNQYKIYTMPLPSSGHVVIGQLLAGIDPFLQKKKYFVNSNDYIHLLCEAEKLAFADRNYYLADPEYLNYEVNPLLDKVYISNRFRDIADGFLKPAEISHGKIPAQEKEETTHFSIIDQWGNAVSLTYTLNGNFGSKAVVTGTGILLNNEMDDFSIRAGAVNMFGLKMGQANAIEPGKRMLSSMSPTIITQNDSLFLITGTPGGATILTTVLQNILNACYFNFNLKKTVELPRFHHQDYPDKLYLEDSFREKKELIRELTSSGYHITWRERIGDVHAIMVRNNEFRAYSDPRGRGQAFAY